MPITLDIPFRSGSCNLITPTGATIGTLHVDRFNPHSMLMSGELGAVLLDFCLKDMG